MITTEGGRGREQEGREGRARQGVREGGRRRPGRAKVRAKEGATGTLNSRDEI